MKKQRKKSPCDLCWTFANKRYKIVPSVSRAWYNGSTSASQAEDEGSIPFARTKNSTAPVAV